ncbi:uncharacterized protein TRIADDRAFT_61439 [Trichoplax adhaerens]|uniref:Uncharacterized protein n=1 Tax=Trichoplax adhaerens TaxID=10228 RepID=B3SAZ8_TRIAD|nr:hypothetical protein TRIADDRAFT_61439 [Trichoplax adhaerens]EDV20022.1 hypothetical protein TRIADDRAFT_61439 [Trichoplax adhaerens]|eukprot:XP_002117406.1 hypothetical protein TRIADDRAFT_61439 [Trichoplax adhaerens]
MGHNISHVVKSSLESRSNYQIESLLQSGHRLCKSKDYENARIHYLKALEIINQKGSEGLYRDQLCCEIYMTIAYIYQHQLQSDEAELYCRLADTLIGQIKTQLRENKDLHSVSVLKANKNNHDNHLISSWTDFGRDNLDALENYTIILASLYTKIGSIKYSQYKYESAVSVCQRAIFIKSNLLGIRGDSDIATMYDVIGHSYKYQGKYTNALDNYHKSLKIQSKISGNGNYSLSIANCYENIGEIFHRQKNFGQALSLHKKSLNIRSKILGYDTIEVLHSSSRLAKTMWEYNNACESAIQD